jgi:hypothetical protein
MKVLIDHWGNYDCDTSNNGGGYGEITVFEKNGSIWIRSYYTTADMPFCRVCGSYNEPQECGCGGRYKILSTTEMLRLLKGKKFRVSAYPDVENHHFPRRHTMPTPMEIMTMDIQEYEHRMNLHSREEDEISTLVKKSREKKPKDNARIKGVIEKMIAEVR